MRHILLYVLSLLFLVSCKTDSFLDTTRLIETDKDIYSVNDRFKLSVVITPVDNEKTIRFYKTFSNLRIYFSLINKQKGIYSVNRLQLKKYFVEGPRIFGSDDAFIDDYTISKENPFTKTFISKITERKNKIIIEIPELNTRHSFDKSQFDESSEISIQGYCTPLNNSGKDSEAFFTPKDIKVLIN